MNLGPLLFSLLAAAAILLLIKSFRRRTGRGPSKQERNRLYSKTHDHRMKEFSDAKLDGFVTGVEISAITDSRCCDECRRLDGKKFYLGKVPKLPLADCTSEMGCRCLAIPITVIDED